MGRRSIEERVRKEVEDYLRQAEVISPAEAPLNTLAVATHLKANRKTLKKYRLDVEIAAAAERRARNGVLSPAQSVRRTNTEQLRIRDEEIAGMRKRCEALVGQICIAEGNAKRLGIDPKELWISLPLPDRSVPKATVRRDRRRF